jgi:hypothetical protein
MGLAAAATTIPNLPAYLSTRSHVPSYKSEPALFSRLPESLRHEVKIWQAAFDRVSSLCSSRLGGSNHSIQSACKLVLSDSIALKGTPLKTFRGKYDLWAQITATGSPWSIAPAPARIGPLVMTACPPLSSNRFAPRTSPASNAGMANARLSSRSSVGGKPGATSRARPNRSPVTNPFGPRATRKSSRWAGITRTSCAK